MDLWLFPQSFRLRRSSYQPRLVGLPGKLVVYGARVASEVGRWEPKERIESRDAVTVPRGGVPNADARIRNLNEVKHINGECAIGRGVAATAHLVLPQIGLDHLRRILDAGRLRRSRLRLTCYTGRVSCVFLQEPESLLADGSSRRWYEPHFSRRRLPREVHSYGPREPEEY